MAETRAKGSIIYELLIIILAVILVVSILYPKRLKDKARLNTELGRSRMSQLLNAELQYQKFNGRYTDTLSTVFNFIKTDQRYSAWIDSVIGGGLDSVLTGLDQIRAKENVILSNIPAALDTTMIDSLMRLQQGIKFDSRDVAAKVEFVHDRMKNLPNMPIDELTSAFLIVNSKEFTLDMSIVRNSLHNGKVEDAQQAANNVIRRVDELSEMFKNVKKKVVEYKSGSLDSLKYCPTTHESYRLVHLDTSVIKYLNIYCPIDDDDIQIVDNNFLKSAIGGLKIQNHGKIESGEISWEAGR